MVTFVLEITASACSSFATTGSCIGFKLISFCAPASEKVSKEKYSQLKIENEQILFNVIDSALKDAELERLNKELKEKDQRIKTLVERIEQLNQEKNNSVLGQIRATC